MVTVDISGRLPSRYSHELAVRLVRRAYRIGGGKADVQVSVTMIDDRTMRGLNRAYRGKDKTTDVLSFPFSGGDFVDGSAATGYTTLGEILVSLPQVRRQAKEIRRSVTQEFSLMLVHGTLHLMGYDHESVDDERRMFGLQHECLLREGIF